MYVMSWVGVANAIGLVIEVPILLRSLADSLADINFQDFPLRFHPSLLAALDDGVANESPSRLVDSYACDWWRFDREPSPDHIFGMATLDQCLGRHRQYVRVSAKETKSSVDSPPPSNDNPCPSCERMRDLVQDMMAEARGMSDFLNGCESAADAAFNRDMRRAAGFYHLHEKAITKELQQPTSGTGPVPKPNVSTAAHSLNQKGVNRQSQRMTAQASAELQRLKAMPASSYKWTWGTDLTEEDILDINQMTKSRGKPLHSGYIRSLPDGPFCKIWSKTPSLPHTSASPPEDPTFEGQGGTAHGAESEQVEQSRVTAAQAALAWKSDDSASSSGSQKKPEAVPGPQAEAVHLHTLVVTAPEALPLQDNVENSKFDRVAVSNPLPATPLPVAEVITAHQARLAWENAISEDAEASAQGSPTPMQFPDPTPRVVTAFEVGRAWNSSNLSSTAASDGDSMAEAASDREGVDPLVCEFPEPDHFQGPAAGFVTAFEAGNAWQCSDQSSNASHDGSVGEGPSHVGAADSSEPDPIPATVLPFVTAWQACSAWRDSDSSSNSSSDDMFQADEDMFQADDEAGEFTNASYDFNYAAESEAEADFSASPTTSRIEHPTPSRITLPRRPHHIYSVTDFNYVERDWLPSSSACSSDGMELD